MATRTPAKRTPKPTPTPPPSTFEPLRIGATGHTTDPGVPLFYLSDTEYRIPTRVPQGAVLEFLRLQRTEGEMAAGQRLLERLLGTDAYTALEQSDEVTDEHLRHILQLVVNHAAGVVVEPGKDQQPG